MKWLLLGTTSQTSSKYIYIYILISNCLVRSPSPPSYVKLQRQNTRQRSKLQTERNAITCYSNILRGLMAHLSLFYGAQSAQFIPAMFDQVFFQWVFNQCLYLEETEAPIFISRTLATEHLRVVVGLVIAGLRHLAWVHVCLTYVQGSPLYCRSHWSTTTVYGTVPQNEQQRLLPLLGFDKSIMIINKPPVIIT